MNNEMDYVNDIAEEVKPSFKERYLNRRTLIKGLKALAVLGATGLGLFTLGRLAVPKELNSPEGAPFEDDDE